MSNSCRNAKDALSRSCLFYYFTIDLAVVFRVFLVLLSLDCWSFRFYVPLICLWILGFFIFPALSSEGRFSVFLS